MANQQIIDYIKENLSGDISIKQIKKSLLDAGWPEQEIDEAIRGIEGISPRKEIPPLPEKSSQKTSILAILSLIFAFLFPLAGLILGIIALSEIKKNPSIKGRGLAIAGIIISSFSIIIYIFISSTIGYYNFLTSIVGYMHRGTYIPSSCEMPPGLKCINLGIEEGNKVRFFITNEMEEDLSYFSVKIGGNCEGNGKAFNGLKKGEQELISVRCTKKIEGETFKEDILIEYKGKNGVMQTKKGLIGADKFSPSFDDLSSSQVLLSKCTLVKGLNCDEFSFVSGNPGSVSLTIENEIGYGYGIIIRSIKITERWNNSYECYINLKNKSPGSPDNYRGLDGWHLANGEEGTVKLVCPIEQTNTKTFADINLTYCIDTVSNNEDCERFLYNIKGGIVSDIK